MPSGNAMQNDEATSRSLTKSRTSPSMHYAARPSASDKLTGAYRRPAAKALGLVARGLARALARSLVHANEEDRSAMNSSIPEGCLKGLRVSRRARAGIPATGERHQLDLLTRPCSLVRLVPPVPPVPPCCVRSPLPPLVAPRPLVSAPLAASAPHLTPSVSTQIRGRSGRLYSHSECYLTRNSWLMMSEYAKSLIKRLYLVALPEV